MKRGFDLIVAIVAAPFAAAIVLILAILIRLTSPGPAIFRQIRVGRNEEPFVCLKLRTMRIDTPDLPSHEVGAAAITPIGRFLRRSKLDELPQLWNILKGEMSFVGPRPCLPSQTDLIVARRTQGVAFLRPGVTGVSQVAGVDMSDPERLATLDSTYLSDMSLLVDLRLMLHTISGAGRGDAVMPNNHPT